MWAMDSNAVILANTSASAKPAKTPASVVTSVPALPVPVSEAAGPVLRPVRMPVI
jgi:hypothetical protein